MGVWLVLAIAVWAGIVVGTRCFLHRYGRRQSQPKAPLVPQAYVSLWPDAWVAVKSRNVFAVQKALSLHNPRPCSWLEGFTNADKLFVSPPVKGWILVTGAGLPRPRQDVDACFCFMLDLSRKLGEVQFFSAHRTLHCHAWVKARNGRIVRAYAWAETTLWQQGTPTSAEKELAFRCLGYTEPFPEIASKSEATVNANVEKVPLLAARWGLDPAVVQVHFPLNEQGVTGRAAYRHG